jgi:hypothetical protein
MKNESKKESASVVDTLFDVGEAWASYGLKTAENAVAASAKTLEGISKLLGSLSEELKREQKTSDVIDVPAES